MEKIIFNKKKINLIYNPYLRKVKNFKRKKFKKPLKIVSAGRLTKQKNFKVLIDSVIFLVSNGYKLELTIIEKFLNKFEKIKILIDDIRLFDKNFQKDTIWFSVDNNYRFIFHQL